MSDKRLHGASWEKRANRAINWAIIYTIGIGVFFLLTCIAIAKQSLFFTILCLCLILIMIWKSISKVYSIYEQ